jgi:predicted phage terminase large subunit-like protein
MSWGMTFKDSAGSDFVVGQVRGKRGADVFLLEQMRGRWTFTETLQRVQALAARWPQARTKLVEDKANGTAVIDSLRKKVSGLIAINPTESKTARAEAVSPFVEAGNVHLPAPAIAPWIGEFIDELTSFPSAAHGDQVDAMTQALQRLMLGRAVSWAHSGTSLRVPAMRRDLQGQRRLVPGVRLDGRVAWSQPVRRRDPASITTRTRRRDRADRTGRSHRRDEGSHDTLPHRTDQGHRSEG